KISQRTRLAYRTCKVQTAASAVGCGWMWSEKLNNRKSDDGMTGDVCYRICTIDRNMLQEQEHWGLEEAEEDDDDEPIFVLTDEWREFFAKSEAKRKLGP
ncbi:hypothetical protein CICLE_v10024415mg, partial [Citrus x clementina]